MMLMIDIIYAVLVECIYDYYQPTKEYFFFNENSP